MANKTRPAYTVADSSSTYGADTPYAVVSTTSGMPQMPTHSSKETAQKEADRLNAEAERAAKKIAAAAQRTADRLEAEANARDNDHESEMS